MSRKLSIGIVGLPNVGKSTLFQILTKQQVVVANYPFATIDPNVGVVAVPDERVERLADLSNSKKKIPAVVEFYDIAGLVKGASEGEGLGNQFLAHIRDTQAIIIVLRLFPDPEVIHVEQSVDPLRDLEIIETELILKDIETCKKRVLSLEKEAKGGDKKASKNLEALKIVLGRLEMGELIQEFADDEVVQELQLLTAKKQLHLLNGSLDAFHDRDQLLKLIESKGADYVANDLAVATGIYELIRKAYGILDLISFFTTGEDETRAWTIKKGTKAPEAAGEIHTDFENKFIRAEVISTSRLLEAGSWQHVKTKGWLRLEGKDYVVQDGDVMVIRHG